MSYARHTVSLSPAILLAPLNQQVNLVPLAGLLFVIDQ